MFLSAVSQNRGSAGIFIGSSPIDYPALRVSFILNHEPTFDGNSWILSSDFFQIKNKLGTMLPSLKAIQAGTLQQHAVTASRRYIYAVLSLPCLKAIKAASCFLPIQSTPSFCTSSWSRGHAEYSSRNPRYRFRVSHLPKPEDNVCRNNTRGSVSDQTHLGYRSLSNHSCQRSHFWGRYGYGWRWSDRSSGTDGRPKENVTTDHALWRTRRKFLERQIANIRKITDADPFGSVLGQRLQSTYKGNEKDKSTDSDMLSRKRQETIEEQFSNLKKMLEEDAYGVLFGRRLETKSPEDVPSYGSTKIKPSKREATSSVKYAQASNEPEFGRSGLRQEAASTSKSEPPARNAGSQSGSKPVSQNEELEFDPITMRKVPKKRYTTTAAPHELGTDESFNIPVNTFKSSVLRNINTSTADPDADMQISWQPAPSNLKPHTVASTLSEPRRGWLARAGFDAEGHEVSRSSPNVSNDGSSESRKTSVHKIESALDRHIKAMNTSSDQNPANSAFLKYPVRDNKEEDVDLLRASDVRASAAVCKRGSRPTAAEKQQRRSILSDDYEKRSQQLDRRLDEELAYQRMASKNPNISAEVVGSSPKYSKDHSGAISEIKKSSPSMSTNETLLSGSDSLLSEPTSLGQKEARKRAEARRAHEVEVNAQKAAMQAVETRDKTNLLPCNIEAAQSQNGGQSGTASNIDILTAKTSSQESDQQLAKEKALIDDIRSIYEDRYGIIDANHRQPSVEAAEISPVTTTLGNTPCPQEATNETLDETPKLVDAERQAGHYQKSSNKGASIPSTTNKRQDHKVDDQSDTSRQLLREVYETQNLVKDLSKQISESQLQQSVLTELLLRPSVQQQTVQQSPYGSSTPCLGQIGSDGTEEIMSDKQAKLHTSSKPVLNHSDSGASSSDGVEAGDTTSMPVSYKILAYDPTTQRVTVARNTFVTSPASDRRLTVAEALSGLTNPAKFLPHLASLQDAGYEIVSGSSNLLIFQKTGSKKPLDASEDEHVPEFQGRYSMPTNPIDGTTPQTGNFASPTGFVNYDSILSTPDSEEGTTWQDYPSAPKPSDKVRRQEEVFSGGWRDSHDEKVGKRVKFRGHQRRRRRWRRTKRMLWVGSCVAGCCYVAAVASEVFRGELPKKTRALPNRTD